MTLLGKMICPTVPALTNDFADFVKESPFRYSVFDPYTRNSEFLYRLFHLHDIKSTRACELHAPLFDDVFRRRKNERWFNVPDPLLFQEDALEMNYTALVERVERKGR